MTEPDAFASPPSLGDRLRAWFRDRFIGAANRVQPAHFREIDWPTAGPASYAITLIALRHRDISADAIRDVILTLQSDLGIPVDERPMP